jgi:hypothetical protein
VEPQVYMLIHTLCGWVYREREGGGESDEDRLKTLIITVVTWCSLVDVSNVSEENTAYKMLVAIYQTTWHHIPEDCIFNIHCYENFKSHTRMYFWIQTRKLSSHGLPCRERWCLKIAVLPDFCLNLAALRPTPLPSAVHFFFTSKHHAQVWFSPLLFTIKI